MAADLIDARWVADYPAKLSLPGHPQDEAELIPRETVIKGLGRHECEDSANWQVLTPSQKPKPLDKQTKDELLAYAAEKGIALPADATTKKPIFVAIQAALAEPDPEPPAVHDEAEEAAEGEGE